MIVYGKELSAEENGIVNSIASECGIMRETARLLFYRNVDSPEKARTFLSPGKNGFHDPMKLAGMKEAAERIREAKDSGESVLIFGDYDADGICATSVLYYCLKEYGITARTVVPEREEGYGLNVETVLRRNAEKKIDLLITVDCGISDKEKIKLLTAAGIDVIVTDHHEPPKELPECIKINPKISGQEYPFGELCGAGVAYKTGRALIGEAADKYLDFVALATVADSMELVGENRDIVTEGLKILNSSKIRKQFSLLTGDAAHKITSQTLAFVVAPRVNAGGRMGDARSALDLFLTEDENEMYDLSVKLTEYNIARQIETDKMYKEAKVKIRESGAEKNSVILVSDDGWRAGFIGIVAAKLVEDYSRPVIVFTLHDGYLKGSARSVEGVNIYDALSSAKDLLLGYGGHSQAAGVTVAPENFGKLSAALDEYMKTSVPRVCLVQKDYAEWNVTEEISLQFAKETELLEPFGVGNRRPIFTTEIEAVEPLPIKAGSPHYSFITPPLEMLDFNGEGDVRLLSMPVKKKVLFELNVSVFKKRESLKGYARKVCPEYGDFSSATLYAFENEISRLKEDAPKYETISKEELTDCDGYGTIYAVSDYSTVNDYPQLKDLPAALFAPDFKSRANCIVVSLGEVPEGYEKVIYLDRPVQTLNCEAKVFVADGAKGYKYLDRISEKRSEFANQFAIIKRLSGKRYRGAADLFNRYVKKGDGYQFVLAATVFTELGIFKVKDGAITFDEKVKNPLTNSVVYSKIYSLKGGYD